MFFDIDLAHCEGGGDGLEVGGEGKLLEIRGRWIYKRQRNMSSPDICEKVIIFKPVISRA